MTSFGMKYGVAFTEEQAEVIERPLQDGDSRSQRIRGLAQIGLAAEAVYREEGRNPPSGAEHEQVVREALEKHLEE